MTEILTPLSDTISKVEIRVANVENLGRVQPLSAKFDIEIRDSYGGLIAQGTSQFEDLEILQPVTFSQIKVERMVLALASPTDIEVSINLDKISILVGSVLELSVSKDQLDLSGNV